MINNPWLIMYQRSYGQYQGPLAKEGGEWRFRLLVSSYAWLNSSNVTVQIQIVVLL